MIAGPHCFLVHIRDTHVMDVHQGGKHRVRGRR